MNWRRDLLCALGALGLMSAGLTPVLAAPSDAAKVVTLRADPSCPSNCEPGSDHPGYDVELAEKIFGKAGYKVDYKLLSWSRTLVEVRKGAIDGFVAGIKTDAPDFIFPEEPGGVMVTGFAVRKDSGWRWDGVKSLDGKVLGYIPDYQYFPELKTYIDANTADAKKVQGIAMMNATQLNLKKLSIGRVDVVCDDSSVLEYYIKVMGLSDKVVLAGGAGDVIPSYIAFGPTNPRAHELAAIWDAGIKRMRASGELKAVLDRYGVPDWKKL